MVVDFPQIPLDKAIVNVMGSGTIVRGVLRRVQIGRPLNSEGKS